jgi:hypothetical protein
MDAFSGTTMHTRPCEPHVATEVATERQPDARSSDLQGTYAMAPPVSVSQNEGELLVSAVTTPCVGNMPRRKPVERAIGCERMSSPGAIGLGDEDVAQQQEHGSGIGKERMAFLTRDHAAKGRENDPAEGEMVVTIVRSYATHDVRHIVHAL